MSLYWFLLGMTFYPQCRITKKGRDRLHDRINNLIITIEAVTVAANLIHNQPAKFTSPTVAALDCAQLPISVKVPVYGPLEAALRNQYPDVIHIDFYVISPPMPEYSVWAAGINKPPPTFGLIAVINNLMTPVFIEYFESYKQWLWDQFGKQENWPMVLQFARLVRNALSHNGCINFESQKAKPVSWYGLTYSPADNGRKILGIRNPDLQIGDLLVLMFEMDDELNRLNCPFAV